LGELHERSFQGSGAAIQVLKKNIADYQRATEKAKKVAEWEAKKAAARAASTRGRVTGNRGRSMRGRGARGRGAVAAHGNADVVDSDSDLELIGMTEPSESSSDSDTESEAEIPIPRSHRPRPVRVIQGHCNMGEG
jgi:hypothetical protein